MLGLMSNDKKVRERGKRGSKMWKAGGVELFHMDTRSMKGKYPE